MNFKKLSPWNWFKNENETERRALPIETADRYDYPMDIMQREINRMFAGFPRGFNFPSFNLPEITGMSDFVLRPKVDIAETDTEYTICVEIPGVDQDNVQLTVDDGTLTIKGEKRQEIEKNDKNFHRVERSYGSFQRVISLPVDALEDKVEAKFKRGVLTISLPRDVDKKPPTKRIQIEAAD